MNYSVKEDGKEIARFLYAVDAIKFQMSTENRIVETTSDAYQVEKDLVSALFNEEKES